MRATVVAVAVSCWLGCSGHKNDTPPPVTADMVRESDQAAAQRSNQRRACKGRVTIYEGSIEVNASDYNSIPDLDRVVSTAPRIDFTLDYPFEKPFSSFVAGNITLRRIIDAVRAGFRHMYEGATVRDIPKLYNKDVNGPYGRAFHAIGDLVIERIDLCDGGSLDISIGS